MYKILFLAFLLCLPLRVMADITDIQSTEGAFIISGAGFGTKSHPGPLFYDDFESGVDGTSMSTSPDWVVEQSAIAQYSSNIVRPGSGLSAVSKKDYDAGNVGSFMTQKLPAAKGNKLVVVWAYIDRFNVSTNWQAQLKLIRIGATENHAEYPIIGYEIFYNTDGTRYNQEYILQQTNNTTNLWGLNEQEGQWMRIKIMVRESDIDTANGSLYGEIISNGGVTSKSADNIVTNEPGDYGPLQWVKLGYTLVNADGMRIDTYWDDVYIDDSFASVELCDSSTWDARTHCEIQIPTEWSDTSVTVTQNRGSFATGDTAYLYVIDSTGAVSNGYPITIGAGTGPIRSAGAPTGEQPAGTTQITMSLTTDEAATCRYSTVAGTAYADMTDTFATTGGTSHSTVISGLANGGSYTYYVRCAGTDTNADDYVISWSVQREHHRTGSMPVIH